MTQDRATGANTLDREEQHNDRDKGKCGDHEIHGKCHEHAAIVEPSQHGNGEHHERLGINLGPILQRDGLDQITHHNRVGCLQHGVGHHQIQPHVECHQWSDNMLGLGVLSAGCCHGGGNFRIDHRDAGVEQADDPAGNQRAVGTAFTDREIPSHVLAHQHDPDTERPYMDRPEYLQ